MRVLDHAAILEPAERRDFTEQRKVVRRFAPAEYAAARLLLPPPILPDVVVLVAFMHETDDRVDRGSRTEREAALRHWNGLVHIGLESHDSEVPVLRALSHTVRRHEGLHEHVAAFLRGAECEISWERFASEAEFDRYVEEYSLPALMLTAGLLAPGGDAAHPEFRAACRALISAMQRLDFLEDVSEDLVEGRLGITAEALAEHHVTVGDLRTPGKNTAAVDGLVRAQARLAEISLAEAGPLVDITSPDHARFFRALLAVQRLRLEAVRNAGASLVARASRPSTRGCAAVLLRELLHR